MVYNTGDLGEVIVPIACWYKVYEVILLDICGTLVIKKIQLETKSGNKQQGTICTGNIILNSLKGILSW